MSNLSISEYAEMARDPSGYQVPAGMEPAMVRQNLTFTSSSVQSAAFQAPTAPNTRPVTNFIRVVSDVDCRLEFGTSPTAKTTTVAADATLLLKAGAAEYFGVVPGQKVAVIAEL